MKNNELTAVKAETFLPDGLPQEVLEKFIALQAERDALAAENERAADAVTVFSKLTEEITEIICDEIGHERVAEILSAFNSLGNLPNTDAAIAEIKAQGVDEYACFLQEIVDSALQAGHELTAEDTKRKIFMARGFAANLRAGRKG